VNQVMSRACSTSISATAVGARPAIAAVRATEARGGFCGRHGVGDVVDDAPPSVLVGCGHAAHRQVHGAQTVRSVDGGRALPAVLGNRFEHFADEVHGRIEAGDVAEGFWCGETHPSGEGGVLVGVAGFGVESMSREVADHSMAATFGGRGGSASGGPVHSCTACTAPEEPITGVAVTRKRWVSRGPTMTLSGWAES